MDTGSSKVFLVLWLHSVFTRDLTFPQNSHTSKLGEMFVFCAVLPCQASFMANHFPYSSGLNIPFSDFM